MDANTGVSLLKIGVGIVMALLAMKPMKPVTRGVLMVFGILLIGAGTWGIFGAHVVGSEPGEKKPSVQQTNPYQSPITISPQESQTMTDSPGGVQVMGDNNTVNQGPQPRRLTPAQEALFVQILRDNPKGRVEVSCIESGGPEPCDFARQLGRLLESEDAGWTVTFSPIMLGAGDPAGTIPALYLEAQSDTPPLFAFVLKEALRAALGHEPVCVVDSNQPPDFLRLTVWHNRP